MRLPFLSLALGLSLTLQAQDYQSPNIEYQFLGNAALGLSEQEVKTQLGSYLGAYQGTNLNLVKRQLSYAEVDFGDWAIQDGLWMRQVLDAAKAGKIKAYQDPKLQEAYTADKLANLDLWTDTAFMFDPKTFSEMVQPYQAELASEDFAGWILAFQSQFEAKTLRYTLRPLALAPVAIYRPKSPDKALRLAPLCWFPIQNGQQIPNLQAAQPDHVYLAKAFAKLDAEPWLKSKLAVYEALIAGKLAWHKAGTNKWESLSLERIKGNLGLNAPSDAKDQMVLESGLEIALDKKLDPKNWALVRFEAYLSWDSQKAQFTWTNRAYRLFEEQKLPNGNSATSPSLLHVFLGLK